MINSISDNTIKGVSRKDRLATCWSAMETIIGGHLPVHDRHQDYFLARCLIYYRMKLDGFSINGTSRLVGVNHATMMNACDRAAWTLRHPRLYKEFAEAWETLNEIVGQL